MKKARVGKWTPRQEHLFKVAGIWLDRADSGNIGHNDGYILICIGKARETIALLKNTTQPALDCGVKRG